MADSSEHDFSSLWDRDDAIRFIREVGVYDCAGTWWSSIADDILSMMFQKIPRDHLQRFE
jgi:hypothetical protein